MTDVGLTGADPLDITQSGQEPTFPWIGWQTSVEYADAREDTRWGVGCHLQALVSGYGP
jgi:hypothetical protein